MYNFSSRCIVSSTVGLQFGVEKGEVYKIYTMTTPTVNKVPNDSTLSCTKLPHFPSTSLARLHALMQQVYNGVDLLVLQV